MPLWRTYLCIVLPFAAGYGMTCIMRTINALLASPLSAEIGIGPAELGLLTAVLFLTMAAVQLPVGVALDRYGPRRVQIVCLLVAAVGSIVFATSIDIAGLVIGRAMIGVGIASALMASLKAIVHWIPRERMASANGSVVMVGALGALAATAPAELVIHAIGWRGLFIAMACLFVLVAAMMWALVPKQITEPSATVRHVQVRIREIYSDPRFMRLAPLSSVCLGTSWSLCGLWAAPWLSEVDGLDRATVVTYLTVMGVSLATSALVLGRVTDRLAAAGVSRETLLQALVAMLIAAEIAIFARLPIPPIVSWSVVAAFGASTVVVFSLLAGYFPSRMSARANAALNMLHLLAAFVIQCTFGWIVDRLTASGAIPPPEAFRIALLACLALQGLAFAWFIAASIRLRPIVYLASART
jgi:MFS family permease